MSVGDGLAAAAAALAATPPVELAAAVLGVLYVVLMIGQHRSAWLAGGISTAVYAWVFAAAGLYLQAALQVYYVAVAVYGWWAWRREAERPALSVSRASARLQLTGLAAVLLASWLSAAWLARETHPSQPYLDSLTTWASVFATWLAARKKIDNWPWWLVIDALIAALLWKQRLYAAMIPYLLYLGLIVVGWRSWLKDLTGTTALERAGVRP